MSVFTASAAQGGPLLRGMPTRKTDLMEKFQESIVSAIAAASGCNVSFPGIDNGIDMQIEHELSGADDVMLKVQLKAVSNGWNASRSRISARLSRERFERLSRPNPLLNSIVVIMDLPASAEDWVEVTTSGIFAHRCCYWVNLAGAPAPPGAGDTITVSADASSVFDDQALCVMMDKIRGGGAP